MILSLMLGLASTIFSVLGLKCTKIGRISESAKEKMALTGGLLFILSGVFSLSAVSWYASRIIHEFHDPLYGGFSNMEFYMKLNLLKSSD
ncbi:Claudin-19 [Dissostichus eleginoides]|uniref:Claudin-19 n=1 Tax=Dissostichus eleginoides TaxID=100907 RepID=A0AAD9CBU2_DISEL|nr:Claudin-19 [Dissostichus eleginoides]